MRYLSLFIGILLLSSLGGVYGKESHINVSPDTLNYGVGAEIPLEVRVNVPEPITSLRIYLTYDSAMLEVREVTPNTATFPFWWKKEVANGVIELEASLPKPGFTGESLVAGVVMVAKESGNKLLEIDENASLLLNAQDENILKLQEERSLKGDFPIANTQSTGLVALFGILLIGGVVFGVIWFLRGRKK